MTHEQLTALNNVRTMYGAKITQRIISFAADSAPLWHWQIKDERMGDWWTAYSGTLNECVAVVQAYVNPPDQDLF